MVTVRIGDEPPIDLSQVSEPWITDQLNRRRNAGQDVCVDVSIETSGLNIRLATPGCGGGGGGRPRVLTANEREVVQLWNQRGLNLDDFSPGSLIAFLKQLRQRLG